MEGNFILSPFINTYTMLITIQHPIVDFRGFINNSFKLIKPYFGTSNPQSNEYIRYFGAMAKRHKHVFYCTGENIYCKANNAVKLFGFDDFSDVDLWGRFIKYNWSENRFYSDGNLLCKFESKSCYAAANYESTKNDILDVILNHHFNRRIGVNNRKGGYEYSTLKNAGVNLAKLYLHASSEYSKKDLVRKFWVRCESPVAIIELFENEINAGKLLSEIPQSAVLVPGEWSAHIKLYHYISNTIPCWIILRESSSKEAFEFCLNLRTALLRIHAEKQTLISTLKFLSMNLNIDNIDRLKAIAYIKKTLSKLLQGKRFEIDQCPIVEMAFKIDDSFAKDEYFSLYSIIVNLNNQYLCEDFSCLFAPVNFEELINTIMKKDTEAHDDVLLNTVLNHAQKRNKLGLKLFAKKNEASLKTLKYSAIYDLLKWVFVSSVSSII